MSTHEMVAKVIRWSVDAAREHVELARHFGETPDPEPGMGLWQSFQMLFPKVAGVDYDMLVTAWSATYSSTVRVLAMMEVR